MHSNIDVALKHEIVDFSHKCANACLSERLIGKIIAARLNDYKIAFYAILGEQALDRLSLNQCEFATSGANTQYLDHALPVVCGRYWLVTRGVDF
jgi:hypothetical protein